jgi:PERQ amino acid-rich with GYF domain-containing protein
MLVNRMPSILTRGLDSALHKRPPVSRVYSSKDVSSDMASSSHIKQKNRASLATSDGISLLFQMCCLLFVGFG